MTTAQGNGNRIAMLCLHTSPVDQPGTGDAGGMNVYVRQLALSLAERGARVDIFTRGEAGALPASLGEGVRVIPIPAGAPGPISKESLADHLGDFTGAIGNNPGYDVIHSHYWMSGVVGLELAERWGIPLVHTMHTMGKVKKMLQPDAEEPPRRILAEQDLAHRADRLTANTRAEAEELTGYYGADARRVDLVPPGVDLSVFHPGDRPVAPGVPGRMRVVFAGRIQKLKGPQILVRALALLHRQRPDLDVKLTILGARSGSKELNLQCLVEDEGVGHLVRFGLPLPAGQLAHAFRDADLVAVPSYSESFGLVAIEAQACGTPVLAHRVGGLPHAVKEGYSGVLVPGLAPEDWAAAMIELAEDPEARQRLGRQAALHALDFSWENTATAAEASYDLAMARGH